MAESPNAIETAKLDLNAHNFFSGVIGELAGTLENVVGLQDASGFVSVVGARIGNEIDREYRDALKIAKLDATQVAAVLKDLKKRIGGEFEIQSIDREKIVFTNTRCPFAKDVTNRPALCMMTSNVFGRIAANNLGYAAVAIDKSIAAGDAGCRVVVYLDQPKAGKSAIREYFS